jgi:hypothetical protein
LGADAAMVSDQIWEMRSSMMDLLTFFTDPDNAKRFADHSESSSDDFAKHLKRIIILLGEINPLVQAEMVKVHLQCFGEKQHRLKMWLREYAGPDEI